MPAGKLSAQAGHAYTNTLLLAQKNFPNLHEHYLTHKITGSKVTLKAKNTTDTPRPEGRGFLSIIKF
jgi:peptidyl-tRNA hydrolase